MYDEPARPSPIPVPIAPPPSARPPPTKAPASWIAELSTAMSLLVFRAEGRRSVGLGWCAVVEPAPTGRSVRQCRFLLVLLPGAVRPRRPVVLVGVGLVVVTVPGAGHPEVEHGQQRE